MEIIILEDRDVSTNTLRERDIIQRKQFAPRRSPSNQIIELEDLHEFNLDAFVVLALADMADRGGDECDFESLNHLFRYTQSINHFYEFRRR